MGGFWGGFPKKKRLEEGKKCNGLNVPTHGNQSLGKTSTEKGAEVQKWVVG